MPFYHIRIYDIAFMLNTKAHLIITGGGKNPLQENKCVYFDVCLSMVQFCILRPQVMCNLKLVQS